MGTWGTAIFSNDLASDIRIEFREKIGFGKSPSEASDELIDEYQEEINDFDDGSIFWLSLAATQWKLGRLQNNVKQKAIEIITNESDLEKWIDTGRDYKKRKLVLDKLKKQLESEQPKAKKIKLPFLQETKMEIGDLIRYNHPSGNIAVFQVTNIHEDRGGRHPVIGILDFFSPELPELSLLRKLEYVDDGDEGIPELGLKSSRLYNFISWGKRDKETWDKMKIIAKNVENKRDYGGTVSIIWRRDFDDFLTKIFDDTKKVTV